MVGGTFSLFDTLLWRMLERLSYRNIDGHLVEPLEDETKLNISPPVTKYFLANLTCTGRA